MKNSSWMISSWQLGKETTFEKQLGSLKFSGWGLWGYGTCLCGRSKGFMLSLEGSCFACGLLRVFMLTLEFSYFAWHYGWLAGGSLKYTIGRSPKFLVHMLT